MLGLRKRTSPLLMMDGMVLRRTLYLARVTYHNFATLVKLDKSGPLTKCSQKMKLEQMQRHTTGWILTTSYPGIAARSYVARSYVAAFNSRLALGTRLGSLELRWETLPVNLETRARNPLWRLAEALGNTGDFCTKINTFGSSTPLDIYK